jgi:hypothetical protein
VNALREIRGIREKVRREERNRVYSVYRVGRSGEGMGERVAPRIICGAAGTGAPSG